MPAVEVSWGELVDKLTILEIKQRRLASPQAVANVKRELAVLSAALNASHAPAELCTLKQRLTAINESLWEIEDRIRAHAMYQGLSAGFAAGELLVSPRTIGTRHLMQTLFS